MYYLFQLALSNCQLKLRQFGFCYRVDWFLLCSLAGCEEKHGAYKAIIEHHKFSNICILSCRRQL